MSCLAIAVKCYNDEVQMFMAWSGVACLCWPIAALLVNVALVVVYRLLHAIWSFFVYCCCRMRREDFDLLDDPNRSSRSKPNY